MRIIFLEILYSLPWSLGNLQTSAHYLDTQRLKSQIATASPNDIAGQIGYSKSKGSIDLLYANHGFSWDWQGIFIGPAQFSNQNTPTSQNILGVGAWWLINSTLGMKVTPAFEVRFIIDNVFNKFAELSVQAEDSNLIETMTPARPLTMTMTPGFSKRF